jgi:four helix bundle protein
MKLPKFELYEEGNQIRRSSKSIGVNIVEGFGRRRYKNDFIKFLTYAQSSCDETKVHLDFIHDTGHISQELHDHYYKKYDKLGSKIYNFIIMVEQEHRV